jgi:RNA polymerase sigma factor (sigma-70 family)
MFKRRSLFAPVRLGTLKVHESALIVEARIVERIAAAESVRRVSRAPEQLPAKLRRTFELRVLGGFSTEETARKLGVTRFVVRTRLRRARIALRRISA